MAERKTYTDEFKNDAAKFRIDHPELTTKNCADKLGIGESTMDSWVAKYKKNGGAIKSVGSGHYSSDKDKENAELRRELRDTTEALEMLKKTIFILGKK